MLNWARVLNTVTARYIKGQIDNVSKRRRLLGAIQKRGKIVKRKGGTLLDFKVKYAQKDLFTLNDPADMGNPDRSNKHKTAQLPWTALAMTESITKYEELVASGPEAVVNLASDYTKSLYKDFEDRFSDELYLDNSVSANTDHLIGFNSALSYSGADSNGYIAVANDTYASLQCALGYYGGSWTGNYPAGYGDPEYHFWSPLIVDYTDTAWTAGATFAANCIESMRYGIMNIEKKANMIDFIILEADMFRSWLNKQDDKERSQVSRSDKDEVYFGYGHEVQYFDGVPVTWEHGVPASSGYGFKMDDIELYSLQDQLFKPQEVDWSFRSQAKRMAIDFYGQLKFNPFSLLHFKNVT